MHNLTGSPSNWRRTLYAVGAGELLAVAGFSTSTPITPLFLQDLGVTDPGRLKVLAGLVQALPSISLVFFSPIWGGIADNYGRKPMLMRAMFGGTVVMLLMGLVTAPWQLVVLKTIQGCITGTIAAATIMVASISPQEEVGYSLGLLQMAIFLGASVGPLVGGVIADLFGRRVNFFATSVLLLAAGIIIARFAEDNFSPPERRKSILASLLPDFRPLARSRALWSLMAVIAADQIAGSVVSPFLPLYIQAITAEAAHVGSTTGLIIGLGAVASALAAIIVGRFSYRLGYRRVLIVCMTGAALFIIPQAFVTDPVPAPGFADGQLLFRRRKPPVRKRAHRAEDRIGEAGEHLRHFQLDRFGQQCPRTGGRRIDRPRGRVRTGIPHNGRHHGGRGGRDDDIRATHHRSQRRDRAPAPCLILRSSVVPPRAGFGSWRSRETPIC